MAQKFCTHCGSPLKPGVNFCTHCGAGVGDNAFSGVAPTATTRTTTAPTTAIPTNKVPAGNAPATAYTGDGLDVPVEQTMVGAPPIDRTQSFQPVVSQPAQPPVYGQPLQPYIPGAQGFDAPGGNRPPKKSHAAVAIAAAATAVAVVAGGATAFVLLGRDKAAEPVTAAATTEATTSQEPATTMSEPATTVAATTTVAAIQSNDDYVIPDSDSHDYSKAELETLSDDQLRIAHNEIYARYGKVFRSEDLQKYFDSKSWYDGRYSADEFDRMNVELNSHEQHNADLLQQIRKDRGQL